MIKRAKEKKSLYFFFFFVVDFRCSFLFCFVFDVCLRKLKKELLIIERRESEDDDV